MPKKKAKKTSTKKKSIQSSAAPTKKQKEKSVLLDLVVKRSSGVEDVYLLDRVELNVLLIDSENFVEISTPLTPGVRFIILRNHDG